MGRPQEPVRQPLADAVRDMDKPPAADPARLACAVYELPQSVMDSEHWHGTEADLAFGLRTPTAGELKRLADRKAKFEEAVKDFVVALGRPADARGTLAREPLTPEQRAKRDELLAAGNDEAAAKVRGFAIVDPVSDYLKAHAWWNRLSVKAMTLVTAEWMSRFVPTEEEGESLRGSRRWVG